MNEKIRLRILGGLVLAVVAIIVFTSLLQGIPRHLYRDVEPPKGFVELKLSSPPSPSAEIKEKLSVFKENRQPQIKEPKTGNQDKVSVPKGKSGLDAISFNEEGFPVRWVVQVASLVKKEDAEKLRQQLVNKGFVSFMHTHDEAESDIIYAVYVGPTLRQVKANYNKEEIDKLFKTKSVVRKWN